MLGNVLKALGLNVHIIESREPDQLKARGAGLSLGQDAQKLLETYLPNIGPHAVDTPVTQILTPGGNVVAEIPPAVPVVTSSWSVMFDLLKKSFVDTGKEDTKRAIYETGAQALKVEDKGESVILTYTTGEIEKTLFPELVIAADGARSTLRSQVSRHVQPQYAGYLAWRGCVPEAETPGALKGALEGKLVCTSLPNENSYLIA
jgi:2-polyprenyl-6-methoxyphenol hydroxylase-like FAD-dependent oxidoreductase